MAASVPLKVGKENVWAEVTSNSRKKANTPPKVEAEKKKIIFHQESLFPQKLKVDLIHALNKALQKAEISTYTQFNWVRYLQFGAISNLYTEKSSIEQLVSNHSNMLISVTKTVDLGVIGVEAIERWQKIKVHEMSLTRYLGKRKIEVLCCKIKSSTGIQLKMIPHWLIS